MSNMIPPMISDSPPPLDVQLDDNDEDDGFGDFRVATDLAFDLSDSSVGRDSPDVWNTPSTNSELSEGRLAKAALTSPLKKDDQSIYFDTTSDFNSITNSKSTAEILKTSDTVLTNGEDLSRSPTPSPDNHLDAASCDRQTPEVEDDDPPEVIEELDRIPFPPVFSSCDVELEARTSPEGADADSTCAGEGNSVDFKIGSVTAGCDEIVSVCESGNPVSDALTEAKDAGNALEDSDEFNDFSDFADFSSQPFPEQFQSSSSAGVTLTNAFESEKTAEPPPAEVADDDFDDFECAVLPSTGSPSTEEEEDVGSKLAAIFVCGTDEVSSDADPQLTGCLHACLDDSSSVWGHLKDLEASHALSLQWTASSASRKLLYSLGVDSRNILIGPRWNSSMPRFAANLGCTPLEPMKAPPDEALPPVRVASRVSAPVSEDVVPAAQFDWNSSGLTNPLDFSPSSLLDLDFLIKFDNMSSSPHAASSVWTPFISMEKEEASVPKEPSELMIKNSAVMPAPTDPSPSPLTDLWQHSGLPTTEILLPSPASPALTPMDTIIPPSLPKTSDDVTEPEPWLRDVTPSGRKEMVTISSQLENGEETLPRTELREEETPLPRTESRGERIPPSKTEPRGEKPATSSSGKVMSAEAIRVVEALPDLSFLSARKLLYAANENMSRFQTTARP